MTVPGNSAFALSLDIDSIITCCRTQNEARTLPPGAIVGDRKGGLTFTDDVAAILENRSIGGWQEVEPTPGERWTIIVLNH